MQEIRLGEKLAALRRQAGLSQEQLADTLGVTRQSVSKWEGDTAVPELGKLIALSDLFGVTVDALVRGEDIAPPPQASGLERQVAALEREIRSVSGSIFSYTSRRRLWGLPLVCVRFGHHRAPNRHNTAVGILAVGNFSAGVVSVGLLSAGGLSLGGISFGLLALGGVSIGALAVGCSALGLVSVGVSALGVFRAAGIATQVLR